MIQVGLDVQIQRQMQIQRQKQTKHEKAKTSFHSITGVRSPVGQVREWTEAWMDLGGMLHLLQKDITALA